MILSSNLDSREFAFIQELVMRRAAISLDENKSYLVESRLAPIAEKEGLRSLRELVQKLRDRPTEDLNTRVVEAMTTNETSFFRDSLPFDALKRVVLPDLIKTRSSTRALRIWCGAASSGQEPYSIALVCKEFFRAHTDAWDVKILGTDLNSLVIERAKRGRYSQFEVARGLTLEQRGRYFTQEGLDWQLNDEVRKMVEYRTMNLIEDWGRLSTFDVVFLRNVLIYFDVATKKRILQKVHKVLAPDGYLFLGSAETVIGVAEAEFDRVMVDKTYTYRSKP